MVKAVVTNTLVTVFSITCIFPTIRILYSSLETDEEFPLDILSLPKHLMPENYMRAIAKGNIGTYFVNNMFNMMTTVCIMIVIPLVTRYCPSRFKFRSRAFVCYMSLPGMLIPTYAPLILISTESRTLGLLNKKYALILPYITFALPVGVFLVGSPVAGAPIGIEEAACIDGSSFLHTMLAIAMLMCKLVLSTCVIFTFLSTRNEFPPALVLIRSNTLKTIPTGLANFVGGYTVNHPLMSVILVVSTLSAVIMYLLFYNQIMKGMMAGAVKG